MVSLDGGRNRGDGAVPLAPQRLAYRAYCLGDSIGPRAADDFLRVAGELVA